MKGYYVYESSYLDENVVIGNGVFLGSSCVFTNDLTPRARHPKGHENYKKILVKEGRV